MNIAFFGKSTQPVKAFLGRCDKIKAFVKPYDAEVEYLRNTGLTQYIDTGVLGGEGLRVVADITPRQIANDKWAIGSYDANARIYVAYQYTSSGFGGYWGGGYGNFFSGSTVLTVDKKISLDVEYTSDHQILKIDGVETERFAKSGFTGTISHTLYLFGLHYNDGNAWSFLCDIGSVQIYMGSVLVRDFIPVRFTNELGQSEGAMYDKVSKQLFRNAGTGAFLYGSDKIPVETTSYVQDGLIAMWDGKENAGVGLHDPNATMLENLTSDATMDMSLEGSYVVNADSVQFTGGYGLAAKYSFVGKSGATISRLASCIDTSKPGQVGWTYAGNAARLGIDYSSSSLAWFFNFGNNPGNTFVKDTPVIDVIVKYDFVWDVTNTRVVLYKNGVEIGRMSNSYLASSSDQYSTAFNTQLPNHFRLMVGGSHNDGLYGTPSQGTVYNCAVYDRALTAAEIAANYAVDKQRFNLP